MSASVQPCFLLPVVKRRLCPLPGQTGRLPFRTRMRTLHHFRYRHNSLHAEDVDIATIARETGTPFFLYSEAAFRDRYRVFAGAFAGTGALVAYSVKANSALAVLKILAGEGAGADVVSGGELARALEAGIAPDRIVFSGVGKTAGEMQAALEAGIYQFNVESAGELHALASVAESLGKAAPVAFRVNPDVKAGGHEKISTGKSEDKFGIAWSQAPSLYAYAAGLKGIAVKGIDVHIGSQITELAPFETAFRKVAGLIEELRAVGCPIDRLDLGGGLGIAYDSSLPVLHPEEYAAMVKRITGPLGVRPVFEPGRLIAGNAGILVTRVIYDKQGEAGRFLIVDAGMNDFMRPALYDAYHEILPVRQKAGAPVIDYSVVGPVCETTDIFAANRPLPAMDNADLLALMSAGAYGAVLASQYNSRPLVPEVLVSADRWSIIRRRPSFREMIRNESVPAWL